MITTVYETLNQLSTERLQNLAIFCREQPERLLLDGMIMEVTGEDGNVSFKKSRF